MPLRDAPLNRHCAAHRSIGLPHADPADRCPVATAEVYETDGADGRRPTAVRTGLPFARLTVEVADASCRLNHSCIGHGLTG